MIPKYPYKVISYFKVGDKWCSETRNYATLPAAMTFRDIQLRKAKVKRVEILAILDEFTKIGPQDQ